MIKLNLSIGTQVIEIERLRFINHDPIVLVSSYLPYAACPSLLEADLRCQSMYKFIENECDLFITRGRRTIEAVLANEHTAQLLNVEKGAPLIMLDSISYLEDGSAIEYFNAMHRGDRSRFEVELVRRRNFSKA